MEIDITTDKEIKLLVVEDSNFMRQLIKDLLSPYKNIKIDTASNGKVALQKIKDFKPDVMTLDVQMDIMDGVQVLENMKKENFSVPTIMFSKFTQKNSDSIIKFLELGAVDFISKPESGFVTDIESLKTELFTKITNSSKIESYNNSKSLKKDLHLSNLKIKSHFIVPKVLVVGASTGGPTALYKLFSKLPEISIPIVVVQHIPEGFSDSMSKRLNNISSMHVKVAKNDDELIPGIVYLAPGDFHLVFTNNNKIHLNKDPDYKGVRPSVDVTLKSAARVFGGRVLSVILTGMGDDGCEGVDEIKKLGGKCIAQDKDSCVVFGMPEAIINQGNADEVSHIDNIHEKIIYYINNWN